MPKKKTQNRVVEIVRVAASSLRANPKNCRTHGPEQTSAMSEMYEKLGHVGTYIGVREESGEITLLDGHLRSSLAGDAEIDVAIVEFDEREQALYLVAGDFSKTIAHADLAAIESLTQDLAESNEGLGYLVKEIKGDLADIRDLDETRTGEPTEIEVPATCACIISGASLEALENLRTSLTEEGFECRLLK